MDKQKLVIALLIISIVLSTVSVITAFAISPDFNIPTRNYIFDHKTVQEAPSSGGISFQIGGGG